MRRPFNHHPQCEVSLTRGAVSYWDHVGGEVLDLALEAAADFAIFVVS